MTKVFIDGSAGTTGLRIHERLSRRTDIQLLQLPEELRKDTAARKERMNQANIVFLCLPDGAAMEAVSLLDNPETTVIDTSTAHRTAEGWEYGFPELISRRARIAQSKRIANPGCHASGFVALVEPLIQEGILAKNTMLSCFSLTGYSGGGKKMIAEYEAPDRSHLLDAPRMYGLSQQHKHIKEMVTICGLETAPLFCPIVAPFYSGMEVTVPLAADAVKGLDIKALGALYQDYYGSSALVHYTERADEEGFLAANALSGKDTMEITVCGNEERILLISRFDNLGKGASGAAIQNMNIVLGTCETEGLTI